MTYLEKLTEKKIAALSKLKNPSEEQHAELKHWQAISEGKNPPEGWGYSTRTGKFERT